MLQRNQTGYTIVELMIVLAVTGLTAVSAFALVQGQQSGHEFSQAVRDLETKIADVANDTATGFFPNVGTNQKCTASDSSNLGFSAIETEEQGSSAECVFAGKVIEFNPDSGDGYMQVISVAARRQTRDGKDVTSFSQLRAGDLGAVPGLDVDVSLLHGLRVKSVRYQGTTAHDSVGFMSGFSQSDAVNRNPTGAPVTDLYWITNTGGCGGGANAAIRNPACYVAPASGASADGIEICLEHGVGGRTALIVLGREGRTSTVTSEIGTPCS